jgi:hypothetical protein
VPRWWIFAPIAAFFGLIGVMALMKLPRLNHPLFDSEIFGRFSDDGFLISIESEDPNFDETTTAALLEEVGAEVLELVELVEPEEADSQQEGARA